MLKLSKRLIKASGEFDKNGFYAVSDQVLGVAEKLNKLSGIQDIMTGIKTLKENPKETVSTGLSSGLQGIVGKTMTDLSTLIGPLDSLVKSRQQSFLQDVSNLGHSSGTGAWTENPNIPGARGIPEADMPKQDAVGTLATSTLDQARTTLLGLKNLFNMLGQQDKNMSKLTNQNPSSGGLPTKNMN